MYYQISLINEDGKKIDFICPWVSTNCKDSYLFTVAMENVKDMILGDLSLCRLQ